MAFIPSIRINLIYVPILDRQGLREIVLKEHPIFIPVPIASAPISSSIVYEHLIATHGNERIEEVNLEAPEIHL